MKKVITYGTYDLLHHGHIRLLERAKALGDYLIVGVTSDDFDRTRGKINVQQSLEERVAAIRATNLADMIIVEEFEGQKIDDIKRYNVDIFTVGSDWKGKFDYLKDYCEVVYLDRTEGVSSSQIRSENRKITLGIVGDNARYLNKFQSEDIYVNGIDIIGICTNNIENMNDNIKSLPIVTNHYEELLEKVDAVYINTSPMLHYEQVKKALTKGKSVLCESPIDITEEGCRELIQLAKDKNCILVEGIRTAYATAYSRLLLLLKSGKIGNILSVDCTCTSMKQTNNYNSLFNWGSNALLPIFQILGTEYKDKRYFTKFEDDKKIYDKFTKIEFYYDNAVATAKIAEGAKSEGSLVITGTKGYVYVPAPWWKMDYFEVRYEDQTNNKRYFYQLEGEGIRYELVYFARSIQNKENVSYIDEKISYAISKVMEDFKGRKGIYEI